MRDEIKMPLLVSGDKYDLSQKLQKIKLKND